MTFRYATGADLDLLALWNHELIQDEGHRNPMTLPELADRMRAWVAGHYRAVLFICENAPVAYAVFRCDGSEVYLRHFFVAREHRRRGFGRQAVGLLSKQVWPPRMRVTVEVLVHNQAAHAFWKAVGFSDYAITLEKMPADRPEFAIA